MPLASLESLTIRVPDLALTLDTFERLGWISEECSVRLPGVTLQFVAGMGDPIAAVGVVGDSAATQAECGYPLVNVIPEDKVPLPLHSFPMIRIDHLAAITHHLEPFSDAWTSKLGTPIYGQVDHPRMVIRQFQVGDCILELLGPPGPDWPLLQRPEGMIAMIAIEVPDLAAAVWLAKDRGFSPPPPAEGVLPNTITSTIPASECHGLAVQLLQYVAPPVTIPELI